VPDFIAIYLNPDEGRIKVEKEEILETIKSQGIQMLLMAFLFSITSHSHILQRRNARVNFIRYHYFPLVGWDLSAFHKG
jgi:hypothetical protein